MFTDLVERQQAEVAGHDFDDRPHASQRRSDTGAHKRRFRERRVANPLGSEFRQQTLAHGVAAAIPADVLAHQEHSIVSLEGFAHGFANGIPVGHVDDPLSE